MSEWSGYVDPTGAEWHAYTDAVDESVDRLIENSAITASTDWSDPATSNPIADMRAWADRYAGQPAVVLHARPMALTTRAIINRLPYLWERLIVRRGWSTEIHRGPIERRWRRARLRRFLTRHRRMIR